jgi:hypothetical protein
MRVLNFSDYVPEPLQPLCEPTETERKSDFIYSLACQYNLKDSAVRELCRLAEVSYPPEQIVLGHPVACQEPEFI